MRRFRKILLAVEGDPPPRGVIARAARLAGNDGAELTLVSAVEDLPWYTRLVLPAAEELQVMLVRGKAEALERAAEALRRRGLQVSTTVLRGRRHAELVREVIRNGHDLLIKEAEPNADVLFGSVDMHLLRQCPCPVWLEKPGRGGEPLMAVLAPVDPSPPPDEADLLGIKDELASKDAGLDRKVLALASDLARHDGADLHVLHAWSAPGEEMLRGESILSQEEVDRYVDDARDEAMRALERLLDEFPEGPAPPKVHLVKGDPAEAIAGFAATGRVDLVVMGTVARVGIGAALIGNTAESILQRVECSVLAVKPDGFATPAAAG